MKIKKISTFFILITLNLFLLGNASASTINVAGETIKTPYLNDFVLITKESDAKFYKIFETFTSKNNRLKAVYIQTDEYNLIKKRASKHIKNYKLIQTLKSLEKRHISSKDFAMLKQKVKRDWESVLEKVKDKLPDVSAQISRAIKNEYDKDYKFEVDEIIPVELMETDNSITSINIGSVNYSKQKYKMVVANTIAKIKGKVLLILSYRRLQKIKDIQELKQSAIETRNAFIKANQL
jgi:translation initiation factor 2 beta subunit (eIF-2beta)/eIF-5